VPDGARWAVNLNPLTGILEGFRWSLMQTPAPSTPMVVWSASAAVVAFLGGSLVFTRMERKFADVI
jgi:lipopolysaccharide transport system permease protein